MIRIPSFSRVLLATLALAVGWNKAAADAPTPDKLYRQYCAVCHGDHGDGQSHANRGLQPPPRDFTTPEAAVELSRERMITSVRDGRPGTAMVAWKNRLSDREIAALVDHIRDHFMARPHTPGRGSAIYARNCAVCHGDRGGGAAWGQSSLDPPPRDFTSVRAKRELSRERMIAAVSFGRPGTAMAAFGAQLGADDITAVVDYVRSEFMGLAATDSQPNSITGAGHDTALTDMALPLPDGLAGDAAVGQAFYSQNCATCHGVNGNGDGPRAYFIVPRPRNFLHPAARAIFNRPALFRAIKDGVIGREMPAWGKVLNDQQIADVTEFVFRTFIQESSNR
ncbi:MAG: c-type cytochrome [Gammaproteobacteria bacterium]